MSHLTLVLLLGVRYAFCSTFCCHTKRKLLLSTISASTWPGLARPGADGGTRRVPPTGRLVGAGWGLGASFWLEHRRQRRTSLAGRRMGTCCSDMWRSNLSPNKPSSSQPDRTNVGKASPGDSWAGLFSGTNLIHGTLQEKLKFVSFL